MKKSTLRSSKIDDSKSLFFLLKKLWFFIDKTRRLEFFLIISLMIISAMFELISLGAVIPFLAVLVMPEKIFDYPFGVIAIDTLGLNGSDNLAFFFTFFFCCAAVISGAVRVLVLFVSTRFSHKMGADLSLEIYRRTLYQNYSIHLEENTSSLISAISFKTDKIIHEVISPSLVALTSFFILIAILIALLLIDAKIISVIFIVLILVYICISKLSRALIRENAVVISIQSTQLIKLLQEGLGGIRNVLLEGSQIFYSRLFASSNSALRSAQASNQFLGSAPRYFIESCGIVFIASLAFNLVSNGRDVSNLIPIIGALALGIQKLLPVLQQLYNAWASLKSSHDTLNDLLFYLDRPVEIYSDVLDGFLNFNNNIILRGVSFSYASSKSKVLSDINLEIKKGEKVGFIGKTGSGKSTLVDIIMGLLEPSSGHVEVDGLPLTQNNRRQWQKMITHVPQQVFLTDSSLIENIALGVSLNQIDFNKMKIAAELAQIAELVNKSDTCIGERGAKLSGGQRQRIGIARAFYKQTDLIILDEATSALDLKTERLVMNSIKEIGPRATILVIAHRLSSLSFCDKIIEIEGGKVKRCGTYYQIINNLV